MRGLPAYELMQLKRLKGLKRLKRLKRRVSTSIGAYRSAAEIPPRKCGGRA